MLIEVLHRNVIDRGEGDAVSFETQPFILFIYLTLFIALFMKRNSVFNKKTNYIISKKLRKILEIIHIAFAGVIININYSTIGN